MSVINAQDRFKVLTMDDERLDGCSPEMKRQILAQIDSNNIAQKMLNEMFDYPLPTAEKTDA